MSFSEKLLKACEQKNSVLVAGFDPRLDSFPAAFLEPLGEKELSKEERIFRCVTSFFDCFLDAAQEHAAAIKPNSAFFEQLGIGGLRALSYVLQQCKQRSVLSILDAKRGDIGSTAQAYSSAYLYPFQHGDLVFDEFEADALTVSPFLGKDTLEPFIKSGAEKGIFVLVRTSNPGAKDLQAIQDKDGKNVSESVGQMIAALNDPANTYGDVGAVIGATDPRALKELRDKLPKSILLIPGYGAQGGSAEDLKGAFDSNSLGAVVNSSRGLISSCRGLQSAGEVRTAIAISSEAAKTDLNKARGL